MKHKTLLTRRLPLLLLMGMAALAACTQGQDPLRGVAPLTSPVQYFEVSFADPTAAGLDPAGPRLAYNAIAHYALNIRAVGADGLTVPLSDTGQAIRVVVRGSTGKIIPVAGSPLQADPDAAEKGRYVLNLTAGVAQNVAVDIQWGMGDGRLVVEELLYTYDSYQRKMRWVRGVSVGTTSVIRFCDPTVANMQRIMFESYDVKDRFEQDRQKAEKDTFAQKPVVIAAGRLIVTGYANDGFYATDISACPGLVAAQCTAAELAWASAYVYTYSYPNVDLGTRMRYVAGQVQDFYSFTEIGSFPSWQLAENMGETEVPPAVVLAAGDFTDSSAMQTRVEPYEAGLVRLENMVVGQMDASAITSYNTYDQWPLCFTGPSCSPKTGGGVVVISRWSNPGFNPVDHQGARVSSITGNLKQHFSAGYILVPRMETDLVLAP